MTGQRFAAIDCGTNSTRLLIAEGGVTLVRHMRITRLGQGVGASGRLHPEAIERVLVVLAEYRAEMDRLGVPAAAGSVRMACTSAVRDAANRDDLLGPATAILGVAPEVLPGSEEARLSFAGATAGLPPGEGPYLVMDIGGGSTEFAVGSLTAGGAPNLTGSISIDVGCVRMTEAYLHSDPPAPDELSACISVVQAYLEDVVREVPEVLTARRLIGLAGTVSTAAAVELGLAEYDRDRIHHFVLTKSAAEDVFRTLATESIEDRRHNPGLEAQRVDVIVGGMCVLVAALRRLGFEELLVSESDILDGLVADLAARAFEDAGVAGVRGEPEATAEDDVPAEG